MLTEKESKEYYRLYRLKNKYKLNKRIKVSNYCNEYKNKNYFGGLKSQVLDRDNFECQKCGLNNEQHIVIYGCGLCVHHIDKDKTNNVLNNLLTLCRSCHAKVHRLSRWKNE